MRNCTRKSTVFSDTNEDTNSCPWWEPSNLVVLLPFNLFPSIQLLSKIKETKKATISTQWQSHMMVQLVQVQTLQHQLLQAHIENHAKRRRVGSFGSADSHLFQFKESSDEVERGALDAPLLKSLTPTWTATSVVSPSWGSGDSLSSLDDAIKRKVATHSGSGSPPSTR